MASACLLRSAEPEPRTCRASCIVITQERFMPGSSRQMASEPMVNRQASKPTAARSRRLSSTSAMRRHSALANVDGSASIALAGRQSGKPGDRSPCWTGRCIKSEETSVFGSIGDLCTPPECGRRRQRRACSAQRRPGAAICQPEIKTEGQADGQSYTHPHARRS